MSFREFCESKNSEEYLIYSYIHKGKPRKKYRRMRFVYYECFNRQMAVFYDMKFRSSYDNVYALKTELTKDIRTSKLGN